VSAFEAVATQETACERPALAKQQVDGPEIAAYTRADGLLPTVETDTRRMSIWVGRYAIVEGAVREHGPAFVDRTRTREDETVRLLVLVEPVDARSTEFAPQVADAVAELFARESLSVTGGLLRALRQAHANLAEWNRRSLREHAVSVGLTCVAIRDGEATIAQVGPGVVYVWGPEGLTRIAAAEGDGAAPVGGTESITPQFQSLLVEHRMLLMLTSNVDKAIGQSAVASALATGAERALADLFTRTRNITDMTAALVADLDVPEEVLAAAAAENGEPQQGTPASPWRDVWEAASATVSTRSVDSGAGSDLLGAARRALPNLRRDRGPYGNAGQGGPGALSRVGARRVAPPGGGLDVAAHWRPIGVALAALLAVVIVGWCALPGMLTQDRSTQLNDALASAQGHITAAQSAPDVAKSRIELDAARSDIAKARGLKSDEPKVSALQTQVDSIAKSYDAVVDLRDGLKRVLAFDGSITAPFNMVTATFGDGALWLVESQRGRVFRLDLSGKSDPTEVYRTGATYGGTTARDPKAIAWDAAGGRLLIADAGPTLFSITPTKTPVPITLRGAKDLKSIGAIATYGNNLYVLDPQAGEVWRYLPGGDGFDSERSGLLGSIDLGDARAFAVDGDFYILGGASLRHFSPPRELPPMLQGVDRPIASAAGVAADAQRRLIYVGDRGGRRIVVTDRDGTYRRQYRHPQFVDIRGVALSADGTTAYVLTGDALYSFSPTP